MRKFFNEDQAYFSLFYPCIHSCSGLSIQAEKDYRRIVKNNEEVEIQNDLKINVAKSSEQEALSSLIEASDFIEFTVGSSTLKITPNSIELSSLNIDVDSSDLTLVEGGLVKINSGVSISGKGSTDVSDVEAAPDAEEFDGFGSNDTLERVLAEKNAESVFKDVEPVQVAGLTITERIAQADESTASKFDGSGKVESIFSPLDVIESMAEGTFLEGAFDYLPTSKNVTKKTMGSGKSDKVVFKNTKDATKAANNLGFKKINETVHGQAVFKKGRLYITRDADGHNGGAWKVASSVQKLGSKSTRRGTFSADLNTRIGD